MKIVFMDGCSLNPGDLSCDRLKQYRELTVYDRTASEAGAIQHHGLRRRKHLNIPEGNASERGKSPSYFYLNAHIAEDTEGHCHHLFQFGV